MAEKQKKSTGTILTNPSASRLPSQRGTFGQPEPVEPTSRKPRPRLGESLDGPSVTVTGPRATTTTKARGGSA
jgi:hypothetical protein